jgi:predicted RNase H-like nuclease (RuvC/YqgF family)
MQTPVDPCESSVESLELVIKELSAKVTKLQGEAIKLKKDLELSKKVAMDAILLARTRKEENDRLIASLSKRTNN